MISPLRFLCINDDKTTVTVIFPTQYFIFQCTPFSLIRTRSFTDISLGSCATCSGTSFIALSGLPADPLFDTRSVRVYKNGEKDDTLIFQHTFEQHILTMRLTPVLLTCAFHDHIEIWQMEGGQQIHNFRHGINIHAPCDISSDFKRISSSGLTPTDISIGSLMDLSMKNFHAADNPVSLVKFSHDGSLVASTSSAGHAIKVWDAETGKCVIKFKRGIMSAVIHSMDFSPDNNYVVVFSQNKTLHFFDNRNRKTEGSAATIRSMNKIALPDISSAEISWFQENKIAVVSMDGRMIVLTIDEDCNEVGRELVQFMQRIFEVSHPDI